MRKSDKIRFIARGSDDIPSASLSHDWGMLQRPKSSRLVTRFSVRLRREGGSLSVTIPRYVVRQWKLEAGMRLVVRSTNQGILLYPRYFLPYSSRLRHDRAPQRREEERDPHRAESKREGADVEPGVATEGVEDPAAAEWP